MTVERPIEPAKPLEALLSSTWYSHCSSERLYSPCNTTMRTSTCVAYGGRPPALAAIRDRAHLVELGGHRLKVKQLINARQRSDIVQQLGLALLLHEQVLGWGHFKERPSGLGACLAHALILPACPDPQPTTTSVGGFEKCPKSKTNCAVYN